MAPVASKRRKESTQDQRSFEIRQVDYKHCHTRAAIAYREKKGRPGKEDHTALTFLLGPRAPVTARFLSGPLSSGSVAGGPQPRRPLPPPPPVTYLPPLTERRRRRSSPPVSRPTSQFSRLVSLWDETFDPSYADSGHAEPPLSRDFRPQPEKVGPRLSWPRSGL
ncbi:hypothetical protein H920_14865 [Fukomys damarensis]|uniref:Uncharacterized protein n=1 Tax=Fukomys damarensis TaxID=885580 RepID=A0A091DLI8_FUKDA|nr:hypothetical protein H920_14865 [Fukomys damarensis]